jgi:poly(3-hydroxybutyrate) depolymerase
VNSERLVVEGMATTETSTSDTMHLDEHATGRSCTRTVHSDVNNVIIAESWTVHGGDHAWFGGNPIGSYTDPIGPDASAEMVRFFLEQRLNR